MQQNNTPPYSLRGGGRFDVCPNCGQKELKPYVWNTTTDTHKAGETVIQGAGRCNRETNCGYHVTPKQAGYIFESKDFTQNAFRSKENTVTLTNSAPDTIPETLLNGYLQPFQNCNLYRYLCTIFPAKEVERAARTVGAYSTADGYVIYLQRDDCGQIRSAKEIRYHDNGKRDHSTPERWLHSHLKHERRLPDTFQLSQCLFGICRLSAKESAGKPIAIVEGEKTALILTITHPEIVWLSTNGKQNIRKQINGAKTALKGRTVTVYPDNGCLSYWKEKLTETGAKYVFNTLCETPHPYLKEGYDIADLELFNHTPQLCAQPNALGGVGVFEYIPAKFSGRYGWLFLTLADYIAHKPKEGESAALIPVEYLNPDTVRVDAAKVRKYIRENGEKGTFEDFIKLTKYEN